MRRPLSFDLSGEAVDETTHVVSPMGEVDAVTAPQLGRRLLGLADEGKKGVVVDLSSVTFMDSTGLGVILNSLKALASRRGKLVLVCPNERVLRPFQVTGLVELIPIFPSLQAAIGGLGA